MSRARKLVSRCWRGWLSHSASPRLGARTRVAPRAKTQILSLDLSQAGASDLLKVKGGS